MRYAMCCVGVCTRVDLTKKYVYHIGLLFLFVLFVFFFLLHVVNVILMHYKIENINLTRTRSRSNKQRYTYVCQKYMCTTGNCCLSKERMRVLFHFISSSCFHRHRNRRCWLMVLRWCNAVDDDAAVAFMQLRFVAEPLYANNNFSQLMRVAAAAAQRKRWDFLSPFHFITCHIQE